MHCGGAIAFLTTNSIDSYRCGQEPFLRAIGRLSASPFEQRHGWTSSTFVRWSTLVPEQESSAWLLPS